MPIVFNAMARQARRQKVRIAPFVARISSCRQKLVVKGVCHERVMPKTMHAIVCHGPEDYRLEEWNVPQPGVEVVIRVRWALRQRPQMLSRRATLLGDEARGLLPGGESQFVGEVVALGEGAGEQYGLQLGDIAVSEQIVPCWNCRFCKRGQYWMCQDKHDVYGFRQATIGAMAEYMLFPVGALNYKVPDSLPAHHAAFIEPLGCSIHAVERGEITWHDVVVIAGCGPLGLGMVAAARLKNPQLLIAIDLNDERLEIAELCGADMSLNPNQVDVIDEVLKLTDGYGCDVYIEATGYPGRRAARLTHDPQAGHLC